MMVSVTTATGWPHTPLSPLILSRCKCDNDFCSLSAYCFLHSARCYTIARHEAGEGSHTFRPSCHAGVITYTDARRIIQTLNVRLKREDSTRCGIGQYDFTLSRRACVHDDVPTATELTLSPAWAGITLGIYFFGVSNPFSPLKTCLLPLACHVYTSWFVTYTILKLSSSRHPVFLASSFLFWFLNAVQISNSNAYPKAVASYYRGE